MATRREKSPQQQQLEEQDRIKAENVARLISDPAFQQARADVRDQIIKEIVELDPGDVAGLQLAKAELDLWGRLDKVLATRLARGKVRDNPAAKAIAEGRLDVR